MEELQTRLLKNILEVDQFLHQKFKQRSSRNFLMELDKANLLVIIISFVFGSALFVITIIAGFIMEHYLFGIVGLIISVLCILIGIIKLGKFNKRN